MRDVCGCENLAIVQRVDESAKTSNSIQELCASLNYYNYLDALKEQKVQKNPPKIDLSGGRTLATDIKICWIFLDFSNTNASPKTRSNGVLALCALIHFYDSFLEPRQVGISVDCILLDFSRFFQQDFQLKVRGRRERKQEKAKSHHWW